MEEFILAVFLAMGAFLGYAYFKHSFLQLKELNKKENLIGKFLQASPIQKTLALYLFILSPIFSVILLELNKFPAKQIVEFQLDHFDVYSTEITIGLTWAFMVILALPFAVGYRLITKKTNQE